jgi:hypothetical protein
MAANEKTAATPVAHPLIVKPECQTISTNSWSPIDGFGRPVSRAGNPNETDHEASSGTATSRRILGHPTSGVAPAINVDNPQQTADN